MKTQKNILVAFMLNLVFSVFEFLGGLLTGSVAIISDAIHDVGDTASIGFSFFLEKKSRKEPDEKYTYGYLRYSVLGGLITSVVLLVGSIAIIYNAVLRILEPQDINYNGMIMFAVVGALVNFLAAFFTREGDSINQKAVNLHMLEDVLGWIVVLLGAVVMRFTDFKLIDPFLSIGVTVFIMVNAYKNLKDILIVFLEKTPDSVNIAEIKDHLLGIDGVLGVHHIHVRSIDGINTYATMHIVAQGDNHRIKELVRQELKEHGICHATLELEDENEHCQEKHCRLEAKHHEGHHHHHH